MTKKQMYNRERSPSPEPAHYKETGKYKPEGKYKPGPEKYEVPSKETYHYSVCSHPIEEICLATNYLANIPEDFKHDMLKFICKEGVNGPGVYAEYVAPPNADTVHQINGSGGYFLKKTVEEATIYLIWYNRARGVYMFWGPTERAVRDAMNRIRGRIVKYVVHVNSAEKSSRHIDLAATPPPKPLMRKPAEYKHEEVGRTMSLGHGLTLETMGNAYLDEKKEEEIDEPPTHTRSDGYCPRPLKCWSDEDDEEENAPRALSRSMSIAH